MIGVTYFHPHANGRLKVRGFYVTIGPKDAIVSGPFKSEREAEEALARLKERR